MNDYDYTEEDISEALSKVGISKGDSILIHSNIGYFGKLKGASDKEGYCQSFKRAIFKVIGIDGTLVVPTFSYSFCNNQVFDVKKTPGVGGMFAEFIREDPESLRSEDANFSVVAIGKNAKYFTENAPEHSFGKNSFWERFLNKNGKLCRFNLDPDYNTFIHYVEKLLNVSYRYDKLFKGKSILDNQEEERTYYHFVRDLDKDEHISNLVRLDETAKKLGLLKLENLGRGQIISMTAKDTLEIIKNEIKKNPYFLVKGK